MSQQVSASEPIYPDQLRMFSLGEGVCSENYRPINREEAQSARDKIVAMMGQWQISGLSNGWIILGPGYNGEIKQGTASTTWCYPTEPIKEEIPELPPLDLPDGDEADVHWRMLHDSENFIKPVSYLAHYLGYAWVGGDHSTFIGEDMDVNRDGDDWIIRGNNSGECSGYRCDEKSSIRVGGFEYTLDPGSFSHGEVTQSDRVLVDTIVAWATNRTDTPQPGYDVTLTYTSLSNWSKTNTYGLSEKVSTKNKFKWPLVGETEVSIEIDANQSWASQNGGSVSTELSQSVRPLVPPHSRVPVKIQLYKASISYPYEFKANINYDITFNGFLRWAGNAWYTHPQDRPNLNYTFKIGPFKSEETSLRYQWDKRYLTDNMKWWDWNWAIDNNGLDSMKDILSKVLRPIRANITGNFTAESQYAGDIEIGTPEPLSGNERNRSSNEASASDKGVTLDVELDANKLSQLGFGNVKMSIAPARD